MRISTPRRRLLLDLSQTLSEFSLSQEKMRVMSGWFFAVMVMFTVAVSFRNPRGEPETVSFSDQDTLISLVSSSTVPVASSDGGQDFESEKTTSSGLVYDFYSDTCPEAEMIVKATMALLYSQHKNVSAGLLRLFFHDCFIQGCDASVMLDDSFGNQNHSIEREAVPNKTLKGFDVIEFIKEEIERVCPGVVSCADILSLATRDGIVLAGGPFYPIFTGRRDSIRSYHDEALAEIPRPDDNITQTLHLFSLRGFNERETVSLLGGHNIGKISCQFIERRLTNFQGTGKPDPTIAPHFLKEMRRHCLDNDSTSSPIGSPSTSSPAGSPAPMPSRGMKASEFGMSYFQELSSSVSSGSGFDTHYYQSLLRGRGLLFADQQLMANPKTAKLVRAYASDDGTTFRMDFAWAMLKMSNLNVLTGSQGEVRLNCSLPLAQSLGSQIRQH